MKLCFMKKLIVVGSLVCSFMGSKAAFSELQHEENAAAVETVKMRPQQSKRLRMRLLKPKFIKKKMLP